MRAFTVFLEVAKKDLIAIKKMELKVLPFAGLVFLIFGLLAAFFHHTSSSSHPDGFKEWVEIVVSALNFLGFMLISRGVILLKSEALNLIQSQGNPQMFSDIGPQLLLGASIYCEAGSLVVVGAFGIDLILKCST